MKVSERWIWDKLSEDVESAVVRAYRRAFNHTDQPSEEQICDGIAAEVMGELSDALVIEVEEG